MFEKFGWKQITKSKIIQHQYDTKKTKKRVKTPPPGFSVLLGQKKLPKGDPPVRTHTFILLTGQRENRLRDSLGKFITLHKARALYLGGRSRIKTFARFLF